MPRPRTFFRFENASTESFHCCGKPEDLLNEPLELLEDRLQTARHREPSQPVTNMSERQLDSYIVATLCNQRRLIKERALPEPVLPERSHTPTSVWSLRPFTFRSTSSSSNLRRKPRVQRSRFWTRGNPGLVAADNLGIDGEVQRTVFPGSDDKSMGDSLKKLGDQKLKHVRSMPLLSDFLEPSGKPSGRSRSKCLSSLSFSGLEGLVEGCGSSTEVTPKNSMVRSLDRPSAKQESLPTNTGIAKTHTARFQANIFAKNTKITGFLSVQNWNHLFVSRNEKERKIG